MIMFKLMSLPLGYISIRYATTITEWLIQRTAPWYRVLDTGTVLLRVK